MRDSIPRIVQRAASCSAYFLGDAIGTARPRSLPRGRRHPVDPRAQLTRHLTFVVERRSGPISSAVRIPLGALVGIATPVPFAGGASAQVDAVALALGAA